MAQKARPDSDVSVGSWSPYPSSPTTLWDKIDEVTPNDDTDYIVSSTDEDECEIGLGNVTDPEVGTGHKIRCYAKSVAGAGAGEQMWMALVENGNVRGQSATVSVSRTAYELIEYTLSEAEANAIGNYANLRLRFHITKTDADEPIRITQAEFECPEATEEHSGTASISGNGSVVGAVKKGALATAVKSAGGVVVAIGLAGMLGIASITGGGAQTVVAKKAILGTVSISGNGAQTVVGKKSAPGSLAISGGGSLTATGTKAEGEPHSGTASISGNGILTGVGKKQVPGNADISANGVVDGVGEKQAQDDLVITGGGSVTVTGEKSGGEYHSGVAVISGNGILEAMGEKKQKKIKPKAPKICNEGRCLKNYEKKKKFTHAQLAADMTAYGWQWTENHIADILGGKVAVSDEHKEFFRRYLLTRYYNATLKEA